MRKSLVIATRSIDCIVASSLITAACGKTNVIVEYANSSSCDLTDAILYNNMSLIKKKKIDTIYIVGREYISDEKILKEIMKHEIKIHYIDNSFSRTERSTQQLINTRRDYAKNYTETLDSTTSISNIVKNTFLLKLDLVGKFTKKKMNDVTGLIRITDRYTGIVMEDNEFSRMINRYFPYADISHQVTYLRDIAIVEGLNTLEKYIESIVVSEVDTKRIMDMMLELGKKFGDKVKAYVDKIITEKFQTFTISSYESENLVKLDIVAFDAKDMSDELVRALAHNLFNREERIGYVVGIKHDVVQIISNKNMLSVLRLCDVGNKIPTASDIAMWITIKMDVNATGIFSESLVRFDKHVEPEFMCKLISSALELYTNGQETRRKELDAIMTIISDIFYNSKEEK